jgi:putative spermidine/putrescine transport system substrate-binding protein
VAQLALAYRTDMVTKKPTSWLDLFSPEYQSCGVALSPPTATGGGPETLSGLAKALGGSLGDPATVDKVFAQIDAGKKSVKAFPATTADMQTLLQRGDVCLAPHWDGRIIQMKQSGIPIALAYPKEGGIAGMNGFAMATGAADPELAYKFLNFVLDPASQAIFANQIFYTMSNTTTTYGDVFNANHASGLPDLNALVWLDHDVMVKNSADWQSRWEKIFR